jgi:hypothetical protein
MILFALAISYVLVIQPDLERPSDLPLPAWACNVLTFIFVFCAVHFSSYLLPPDARQRSAMISGVVIILVISSAMLFSVHPFRPSVLLVPMILDLLPTVAAVILSISLHAHKFA